MNSSQDTARPEKLRHSTVYGALAARQALDRPTDWVIKPDGGAYELIFCGGSKHDPR